MVIRAHGSSSGIGLGTGRSIAWGTCTPPLGGANAPGAESPVASGVVLKRFLRIGRDKGEARFLMSTWVKDWLPRFGFLRIIAGEG